jgi:hypothetical protein
MTKSVSGVLSTFVRACVLAACSLAATAQESTTAARPDSRLIEVPITLDRIRNFHVTSLGRVLEDGYSERSCNVLSTYTDANFGGGSFRVEAGFAEREMFAATYTIAASEWPIKINLAEAVFATSNATVNTVTQWSILFWEGVPQGNAPVFSEVADDTLLPYIRIPAGTNGVNMQFSIDTSDPDQLILNDNGSHQFTVAWRIDHHNQQISDPCLVAPPTCCNAFPVVDVSGLSNGANNWLYGVNCGSFGCPSNGGWSRFSNLNSLCRPTGDIVTRVTWSSVACQPGLGACCLPDGSCQILSDTDCAGQNGTYRGEFTTCNTANCPAPSGACCLSNGACLVLSPANCTIANGSYLGNNVVCGANSTCPLGACCLPSGGCVGGVSDAQCVALGGAFRGVGTTCSNSTCPTGGCCLPAGNCVIATQIQCTSQGGAWRGANSTCTGANCPQPTGACCIGTGCIVLTAANCAIIPGATFAGPFTTCVDSNGNGVADVCDAAPCPADYNQDGGVDGADIQSFFVDWASAAPNADVNQDGGIDGGDIEYFFVRWEAGGC